ncbi:MAG: hypothetical protein H7222_13120 [Methylotenera sp.]|nr:hypothetical protein [Oligoflexia bacterium]
MKLKSMSPLLFAPLLFGLGCMSARAEPPLCPWPFTPQRAQGAENSDQALHKIGFVAFSTPVKNLKFDALTLHQGELELKLADLSAKDFLEQAQTIPFSYFKSLLEDSVPAEQVTAQYQSYLKETGEEALAEITLGRILDHEALRMRTPTEASLSRINYVLRAILVAFRPQDPVESLKVGPVTDLDPVFQELKKAVGSQPVRFNIDWKNCAGSLQFSCMQFKMQPTWPEVHLEFKKFPVNLGEFSQAVGEKLRKTARGAARLQAWQRLVSERRTHLVRLQPVISHEELRQEYKLLKQPDGSAVPFEIAWKDRKTQDLLIQKVKDTRQNLLSKKILVELYSENPFVEQTSLCLASGTTCLQFKAERWAEQVNFSNSISR